MISARAHAHAHTLFVGIQGIPPEWRALLEASGISNEEVESNPAQVMKYGALTHSLTRSLTTA